MNKFKAIGLIVLSIFLIELSSEAFITSYGNSSYPYNNSIYSSKNDNPYSSDLSRIENFLFGRTYRNSSNNSRLNRIEQHLFNQTYSNMSVAKRLNNALANYRGDYYYDNQPRRYYNTQNRYYRPNTTVRNRVLNTLIGQPTGYTPMVRNTHNLPPIFNGGFSPSYNTSYSGPHGFGQQNYYRPTMTGAGIHILD